jgi:hypothetical protein
MQHADYFKKFLADEVNLDDTRLNLLERRVDAVYAALRADDTLGPIIGGISRQGSWKHRLIIKPRMGGDFDADVLLEMTYQKGLEPARYIDETYNAVHRHPTYSKQGHGRKCRCVFLTYAPKDGVGCHLDIVPFVTLPDGRRVIVNRDDNSWEPEFGSTDPKAFSEWVKRCGELANGHFRAVGRITKFITRERRSFNGVKSVVLVALLGQQVTEWSAMVPGRYTNIPTALLNIVEDLDTYLQARPSKPHLPNPAGDGTDFDHRWTEETYGRFRDGIHTIGGQIRAAYDQSDAVKSAEAWRKVLGDRFDPPGTKRVANSSPFSTINAGSAVGVASRSGRAG